MGAACGQEGRFNKPCWVVCIKLMLSQAAQLYHEDNNKNNEYLPISGEPAFCKAAAQVLLGSDLDYESRVSSSHIVCHCLVRV